ncbi:hypothetical protein VTN77DRAFT_7211 [Rasamsonia byssochlamydoides]|uniref:uncharacterized protein n=1 Tax=Rasamsonia byssochlamydoides TaxID=89139 RepID=UPI003743B3E6
MSLDGWTPHTLNPEGRLRRATFTRAPRRPESTYLIVDTIVESVVFEESFRDRSDSSRLPIMFWTPVPTEYGVLCQLRGGLNRADWPRLARYLTSTCAVVLSNIINKLVLPNALKSRKYVPADRCNFSAYKQGLSCFVSLCSTETAAALFYVFAWHMFQISSILPSTVLRMLIDDRQYKEFFLSSPEQGSLNHFK